MTNLIFKKVTSVPASGLSLGCIYFDTSTSTIKVATSENSTVEFAGVSNVTFSENVLKIYKSNVVEPITVDLSDVASASAIQAELNKKLNIGTSGDAAGTQSYYGLVKDIEGAITTSKEYTDEAIKKVPTYAADTTTIKQTGTGTSGDPIKFSVADALVTKINSALQTAAGDTYVTLSVSGTKVTAKVSLASDVNSNEDKLVTAEQVKTYVDNSINTSLGAVYTVKGTKTSIDEVLAIADATIGNVWNVETAFELNGKPYPAGTNVVCIEATTGGTGNETKWDALGGTIDLTPYLKLVDADKKYVPQTRTINNKALSANVTLTGNDLTVGGKGSHSDDTIDTAIETLYTDVAGKMNKLSASATNKIIVGGASANDVKSSGTSINSTAAFSGTANVISTDDKVKTYIDGKFVWAELS